MASLGSFILLTTFVVCSYAAAASVVGARRRSARLTESGVRAFYFIAALMTLASAIIVHAFVTEDYSITYVARYSDSVQPLFYKVTSYWGGLDGSIMFWVFLLSVFGAVAVRSNRERHRELIPYVVAVISAVEMFFLYVMISHNNPFSTYLTQAPADGEGLNPLLQNFYMAIHPPSLYIGYIGMTIPFAFGMAALITGHLDDSWLRAIRRWTMVSWLFLSLGLTLGMIWAYEELGWGGWWGWDPVENAGLLPWFTATALLHSVMVQERRSMLRVWNISLVIVTFFLTIFGTFMTRSGVVQSVHAFGEDRSAGVAVHRLHGGVAHVQLRAGHLSACRCCVRATTWSRGRRARPRSSSTTGFCSSRRSSCCSPRCSRRWSEAITGERLTVGPPFFNTWMLPIGLALLFLTGVGPLLAWRKSTLSNLAYQFAWPTGLAVATAAVLYALDFRVWVSGICFALSAFVLGTIGQEFVRGAKVRQGATGTDILTALIGLVARSRRRYGGYLVHVGIMVMFLGFAGAGYKQEAQVLLQPGEQAEVGSFTVRYDALRLSDDGQKEMHTAYMTVFRDGQQIAQMYPARWFFRKHETDPTTEVAIRRTISEDLYITLNRYEGGDQAASFKITVNPLVNWIWFGFAVLALGTGIALLPESALALAAAKAPAGAATASMLLLAVALMASWATPVRAEQRDEPRALTAERRQLESELHRDIVCVCGTCSHLSVGTCVCATADGMRQEIATLVDDGKTKAEVYQYFIDTYGSQEPLGAPLSPLPWLLPYALGGSALIALGVVAVRWSRREPKFEPPHQQSDPQLETRLDDELRNLD